MHLLRAGQVSQIIQLPDHFHFVVVVGLEDLDNCDFNEFFAVALQETHRE